MAEETAEQTADERVVAPKTVADLKSMTALKETEASRSFANFMNENLGHIEGYEPISATQAWVLIYLHRVWQQSNERAEEKKALKESKEKDAEQKRIEREAKAEERKKVAAEKKAEKERKAAEKAAQKAAAAESDEDLDSVDDEGEGTITESKPKKRRRPAPKATEETAEVSVEEAADLETVDA